MKNGWGGQRGALRFFASLACACGLGCSQAPQTAASPDAVSQAQQPALEQMLETADVLGLKTRKDCRELYANVFPHVLLYADWHNRNSAVTQIPYGSRATVCPAFFDNIVSVNGETGKFAYVAYLGKHGGTLESFFSRQRADWPLLLEDGVIERAGASALHNQIRRANRWSTTYGKILWFGWQELGMHVESEPVMVGAGTYSIKGEDVLIQGKPDTHNYFIGLKLKCRLKFREHAFQPQRFLGCCESRGAFKDCTNQQYDESSDTVYSEYFDWTSFQPAGVETNVDGVRSRTMGRRGARLKIAAYMRKKPDVRSPLVKPGQELIMSDGSPVAEIEKIACWRDLWSATGVHDPGKIDVQRFPPGTWVVLQARTQELAEIDGHSEPWYFVSIMNNCYGDIILREGWMHGSLLVMDPESDPGTP